MASGGPPAKEKSVLGLEPVPFKKLYTFATAGDVALVVIACVSAAASGAILPLFSLVFGASLNVLNSSTADIVAQINTLALYFLLIAIGAGVLTFLEGALIVYSTEKQLYRVRAAYVRALLRLDLPWYDTHRGGEAVSKLADATVVMGAGMEKLTALIRYSATLCAGLAVGFATSWKLTLVIMASAPLFAIALAVLIITAISSERAERAAYARAGAVANEVFSLIRAVAAFGGEAHESGHYGKYLSSAEAAGIRKGLFIGLCVGFMLFTFFLTYAISTVVGAVFVQQSIDANPACFGALVGAAGCTTGGTIVTTFVAVLLGALSFGQIGPLLVNLSAARAAAADLFGVIDALPATGDIYSEAGYRGGVATAAELARSPGGGRLGSPTGGRGGRISSQVIWPSPFLSSGLSAAGAVAISLASMMPSRLRSRASKIRLGGGRWWKALPSAGSPSGASLGLFSWATARRRVPPKVRPTAASMSFIFIFSSWLLDVN